MESVMKRNKDKKIIILFIFSGLNINIFAAEEAPAMTGAKEPLEFIDDYFKVVETDTLETDYSSLETLIFKALMDKNVTYTPLSTQAGSFAWQIGQTIINALSKEPSDAYQASRMETFQPVTLNYQEFIDKFITDSKFQEALSKTINPEMLYDEACSQANDVITLDKEITPAFFKEMFESIFTKYEEEIIPISNQKITESSYPQRQAAIKKLSEFYFEIIKNKIPEVQAVHERMCAQWADELAALKAEESRHRKDCHQRVASPGAQKALAKTIEPAAAERKRRVLPAAPHSTGKRRQLPKTPDSNI